MSPMHFSLIFTGTVSPNGGDEKANDIAMTRGELNAHLEQAVLNITGNGLVTGDTPATLEDHSHCVRITTGKVDMMAMPIISIAHLDAATALNLSNAADQCNWAVIAPYAEGMFIRFLDEDGLDAEIPQCARDIHQWLKDQGLNGWVRLDCDWDCVDGLPAYEW